jgi:hypothetical protein
MLHEMEQLPDSAVVTDVYAAVFVDSTRSNLANWRWLRRGPPYIAIDSRHIRYEMGALRKFRAERRKMTRSEGTRFTRGE